jgi:NADPH:quinone reductase-like Zn-dependent oxidoreductase
MKAAIVQGLGQTPVYADFADPAPASGEVRLTVIASALSPLVKGRASGAHYSSSGKFPFVVGVDGVGRRDDGTRVYFMLPSAPNGSMAEQTVVRERQLIPLPADLDDVTAAAIANPGMSSWAAYAERAKLKAGETVLVNGATGTAGILAVQIAKHFGASKVIATGRNPEVLTELSELGADVTLPLTDDLGAFEAKAKEQFEAGIDVVIDYLWGRSAEVLLKAGAESAPEGVPLRFVQVGSISGPQISLPAAVLRSSSLELMGSGLGSVPKNRLVEAISGLLLATVPKGFRITTKSVPLADVATAWSQEEKGARTVFTVA